MFPFRVYLSVGHAVTTLIQLPVNSVELHVHVYSLSPEVFPALLLIWTFERYRLLFYLCRSTDDALLWISPLPIPRSIVPHTIQHATSEKIVVRPVAKKAANFENRATRTTQNIE